MCGCLTSTLQFTGLGDICTNEDEYNVGVFKCHTVYVRLALCVGSSEGGREKERDKER